MAKPTFRNVLFCLILSVAVGCLCSPAFAQRGGGGHGAAEVASTAAAGAVFGEAEVLEKEAFGAVAVLETALAAVRLEAQAPTADLMPHLTEDRASLALPPAARHTEEERVHMAQLAAAALPMV